MNYRISKIIKVCQDDFVSRINEMNLEDMSMTEPDLLLKHKDKITDKIEEILEEGAEIALKTQSELRSEELAWVLGEVTYLTILLSRLPSDIQKDPKISSLIRKVWVNAIYFTAYDKEFVASCPFKEEERIKKAILRGWLYLLSLGMEWYEDIPEELLSNPLIEEKVAPHIEAELELDRPPAEYLYSYFRRNPLLKQQQKGKIVEWIEHLKKYPNEYPQCPIKDNREIKKAVINSFIEILKESPNRYEEVPEELRNEPEIENAQIQGWVNLIIDDTGKYHICPEHVIDLEVIKEAYLAGWVKRIIKNPLDYKICPVEFTKTEDIKTARLSGWKNLLIKNPRHYPACPFVNDEINEIVETKVIPYYKEEMLKSKNITLHYVHLPRIVADRQDIIEAALPHLVADVEDYVHFSPIAQQHPVIKRAAIDYWEEAIKNNSLLHTQCPKQLKNEPVILAVTPKEKERIPISNYFINNTIYRF